MGRKTTSVRMIHPKIIEVSILIHLCSRLYVASLVSDHCETMSHVRQSMNNDDGLLLFVVQLLSYL